MSTKHPAKPGTGNRISRGVSRVRKLLGDLPFIGAGPQGGRKLQAEAEKAAEKASNSGKLAR